MTTAQPSTTGPMLAQGEPLHVPPHLEADNLLDLIHRTVERVPNREAIRW